MSDREPPEPLPEPEKSIAFDGDTYDPGRDHARLKGQLLRVYQFMLDNKWHTLAEIAKNCEGSEASCSARLRDLRKEKYGAMNVSRRNVSGGLHIYRLGEEEATSEE